MLYFFKINNFFSKALLDSSVSLSKTDSFWCIYLYMLMSSAHPPLSSVEEQMLFANNHKK